MDKNYWDEYYKVHGGDKEISNPSSFAKFILKNYFSEKKFNIVELGSGNGRDAIFFAYNGHNVIAIDQSKKVINIQKQNLENKLAMNLHSKAQDFVKEDYSKYEKIDAFYSRFTIHSISKSDELELLPKIYDNLEKEGLFCIEVRTINDPLYGIGDFCSENTFVTDNHKRRFIDTKVFRKQVLDLGFKELYFIEENNLSIYKNDNPVLMRIILQK
tara:strand:- start:6030 stop:6674 length:645 start_codon:yes stop_codon:yes gene_type:complete